jgi:hypothetical protein
MRRLVRPRVVLPTLVQIRTKYPFDTAGRADFPEGKWNNPDVRGALYAMHGRVCAYCGSIASDRRGDVEHYRPRSVYPWLAYEFANYLLGCSRCNSARKSNQFPLSPRARPVKYRIRMVDDPDFLRRALASEKRLLLDPVDDPIDDWVEVDYESDSTLVRATAIAMAQRFSRNRVEETITFFGLNTIVELVQDRNTYVTAAIFALRKWLEGEAGKASDVRALSNRYTPHGWAVRRVTTSLAPAFVLPTAEEDLKWLVNQTLDQLDLADSILARNLRQRDRDQVVERKEEASWTLAALWKDPPAATPADVEAWINARGRRAGIEAFLNRLGAS